MKGRRRTKGAKMGKEGPAAKQPDQGVGSYGMPMGSDHMAGMAKGVGRKRSKMRRGSSRSGSSRSGRTRGRCCKPFRRHWGTQCVARKGFIQN